MARVSAFEHNPDLARQFAEVYAEGASREELATAFGIHKDTVTRWTKRPDVQAIVTELRQQKANRILRKVDSRIEGILENEETLKNLDLKDLLAIKKEYTPQRIEVGGAGDFDRTAAELGAWEALDSGETPPELPEIIESTAEEDEDE
jgi:hypothetical protein